MSKGLLTSILSQVNTPYVDPVGPTPVGPEMIMSWNTSLVSTNSSNADQIELPLRRSDYTYDLSDPDDWFGTLADASTYDFWVDWGDGTGWSDHITAWDDAAKLHTYAEGGVKTVKVKGQFGSFYFGYNNSATDRNKILDISQFDSMIFDNCYKAFDDCENLTFTATDAPVLSLTKSGRVDYMFQDAILFNGDISAWDFSNATSMGNMFLNAEVFNQDLSGWDMSGIEYTIGMFSNTDAFNQDLGDWDMSSNTDMKNMFYYSSAFNNGGSPSISGWTTSAVTNMQGMFAGGSNPFNQPIGNWDTGAVKTMYYMFFYNAVFNQDIGNWDVSSVESFQSMFYDGVFNNGGSPSISGWTINTTTPVTMVSMFNRTDFNQAIGAWDVSEVTSMDSMFFSNTVFNNGGVDDLKNWDTSNVTDFDSMFTSATAFNQDIGTWDMSKPVRLYNMFRSAGNFNNGGSPSISGWTFNMTAANYSMQSLFAYAYDFNQDIGAWDVSNVVSMREMFAGAYDFQNGGSSSLSGWTTSSVTDMYRMFNGNRYFNVDINAWDVSNVTNMYQMFGINSEIDTDFNGKIYDWQPTSLAVGTTTGLAQFHNRAAQTIPTVTYDQILINWAALAGSLPNSITAGFGGSKYTSGGTAQTAHDYLTGTKGWTITDGGAV